MAGCGGPGAISSDQTNYLLVRGIYRSYSPGNPRPGHEPGTGERELIDGAMDQGLVWVGCMGRYCDGGGATRSLRWRRR